jgi:hypothetical protein
MDQLFLDPEFEYAETDPTIDYEQELPKLIEQTSTDIISQIPNTISIILEDEFFAAWISMCDIQALKTQAVPTKLGWQASWMKPITNLQKYAEENLLTSLGVFVIISQILRILNEFEMYGFRHFLPKSVQEENVYLDQNNEIVIYPVRMEPDR